MASSVSDKKQFVPYVDSEICSHRIQGVCFRTFTDDEIRKISVKSLRQPETFDCLGHATAGGLYDLELGPQRVEGPCVTCGLNLQDALPLHRYLCPGHMAFIPLAVPVFNPVLFKEMFLLLRCLCFECHHLRVSAADSLLFTHQISAVSAGLLSTASDLLCIYRQVTQVNDLSTDEHKSTRNVVVCNVDDAVCRELKHKLNNCLTDALKQATTTQSSTCNNAVRNIVEMKQHLVREFVSLCRRATLCSHCRSPAQKLRQEGCCKVFYGCSTNSRQSKRFKKQTDVVSDVTSTDVNRDATQPTDNKSVQQNVLYALEVRKHLRDLWVNESSVLCNVFHTLGLNAGQLQSPVDIFFKQVQPVTATRFRPLLEQKGYKMVHAETDNLLQVLKQTLKVEELLKQLQSTATDKKSEAHVKVMESVRMSWQSLQGRVNSIYDANLGKMFSNDNRPTRGIKQVLERKEGLFRWNMMGKRVDFAARSVISPDPCIATNEVGIPLYFAKRLTYPEPVTPYNVHYLRRAVINGPDIYPGATHVVFPNGEKKLLSREFKSRREAVAKQLLVPLVTSDPSAAVNIKVLRHIRNGDVLFMNRQPSLHRPSMQAHRARILPHLVEEKTLRMHYANCKAYNADFDGDEMNAHFPQTELARAECYHLASTDYQYLVPKDGSPLAGLIQDYMVSGVWLMVRGQFFNFEDYQQLVYAALIDHQHRVKYIKPSIVKPVRLWSGKQVVSTLLLNLIPRHKPALSLIGKSNVADKKWTQYKPRQWLAGGSVLQGSNMSESEVVILNGHLLVGVLDKAHYGASSYGLVHCCYELYGGPMAGKLLTSLARLFNSFLQMRGFTMGVEDILVKQKGNMQRRELLSACDVCGPEAAVLAFGLREDSETSEIEAAWRQDHFSSQGDETLKRFDLVMNKKTNDCQDCIKKLIMPEKDDEMPGELLRVFPQNNLQMMFLSGAKGTQVNCVQISCTLGQISLEGRRPPLMLSGASLPSFLPYDVSPRAGGFVAGRFLTGLKPQEYFFHCMAGREGLVDTAVKTSHSGYLQRCLIKHLEGLVIAYDMTVRDADGSVIQFLYGEDGADVMKTSFVKCARSSDKFPQFPFIIGNKPIVVTDEQLDAVKQKTNNERLTPLKHQMSKWLVRNVDRAPKVRRSPFLEFCAKNWSTVVDELKLNYESTSELHAATKDKLIGRWRQLSAHKKHSLSKRSSHQPDPVNSVLRSDRCFGSVSERLDELIDNYMTVNPDKMLCGKDAGDSVTKTSLQPMSINEFPDLMYYKYQQSLVCPGEAVGLLAAQSIGEPSTQMTLNTFHFAGHQAMNVTLGIPRLREILMTASVDIKTPIMEVAVLNTPTAESEAERIAKKLTSVSLAAVLKKLTVDSYLAPDTHSKLRSNYYRVRFEFHRRRVYRDWSVLSPSGILAFIEKYFLTRLNQSIEKHIRETKLNTLLNTTRVIIERSSAHATTTDDNNVNNNKDATDEIDEDDDDKDDDDNNNNNDEEADYDEDDKLDNNSTDSEADDDDDVVVEDRDAAGEFTLSSGDDKVVVVVDDVSETKSAKQLDQLRLANVRSKMPNIVDYTYDVQHQLWCEVTLKYLVMEKSIDVTSVIEREVNKAVLYQTPGIKRALAKKRKEDKEVMLRTEGLNIQEMYKYANTLDLKRLYTNNIHAMAQHYGIEAAYQAIIKEVSSVFELYKITVDRRHLSLIADYMTFEGSYKPFNRLALETSSSPLQKMTFETSVHFLTNAIIEGATDNLESPSARIVVGRVMKAGTGYMDTVIPLSAGTTRC